MKNKKSPIRFKYRKENNSFMKRTIFLITVLGILFLIPIVSAESPQVSVLEEIRNILSSILETLQNSISPKLQEIADKNTTINVNVETPEVIINPNITIEPTLVVIENRDEMPRRGNIILMEPSYVGLTNPVRTEPVKVSNTIFISLPNGECSVTTSTDCGNCEYKLAKNSTEVGVHPYWWTNSK